MNLISLVKKISLVYTLCIMPATIFAPPTLLLRLCCCCQETPPASPTRPDTLDTQLCMLSIAHNPAATGFAAKNKTQNINEKEMKSLSALLEESEEQFKNIRQASSCSPTTQEQFLAHNFTQASPEISQALLAPPPSIIQSPTVSTAGSPTESESSFVFIEAQINQHDI